MLRMIVCLALLLSGFIYQYASAETITDEQVVEKAFSIHPMVVVSRSEYNQALGQRMIDLSPESPSLALEYEGVPKGDKLDTHEARTIRLSQGLEFPINYYWRAKRAGIFITEARINALMQLLDIELEVRKTYIHAWLVDQQYIVLQENVIAANAYSHQLKRLVELGESAPLEERRAKVEALQAITDLNGAFNERLAVWGKLKSLSGVDTSGLILEQPLNLSGHDIVLNLDDSYEIESAITQSNLAEIDKRAATFTWLPTLEIAYFQQTMPSEIDPDFWGIEAGISLPFWYWIGGRGDAQVAQANLRSSRARLENIRIEQQNLATELVQAKKASIDKLKLFDEQILPLATEAYKLALKSYKVGEANYLEVLDAQRTLLEIRLDHLKARAELAELTSEIDRLTGRSLIGTDNLLNMLTKGH